MDTRFVSSTVPDLTRYVELTSWVGQVAVLKTGHDVVFQALFEGSLWRRRLLKNGGVLIRDLCDGQVVSCHRCSPPGHVLDPDKEEHFCLAVIGFSYPVWFPGLLFPIDQFEVLRL